MDFHFTPVSWTLSDATKNQSVNSPPPPPPLPPTFHSSPSSPTDSVTLHPQQPLPPAGFKILFPRTSKGLMQGPNIYLCCEQSLVHAPSVWEAKETQIFVHLCQCVISLHSSSGQLARNNQCWPSRYVACGTRFAEWIKTE